MVATALAGALPAPLRAQDTTPTPDSVPVVTARVAAPRAAGHTTGRAAPAGRAYWLRFALGAAGSILLHEAGHVGASYAMGAHPSFGFDRGRPTVYSGIDANADPRRQFVFSSAGLTAQTLLDELLLDVPHARGSALERGLLAGGIGTALFYSTLGRNASVSDVTYMARTSSLSRTDVSLIYGGMAVIHALRIHHDPRYARFWAGPAPEGGMRVGVRMSTR